MTENRVEVSENRVREGERETLTYLSIQLFRKVAATAVEPINDRIGILLHTCRENDEGIPR